MLRELITDALREVSTRLHRAAIAATAPSGWTATERAWSDALFAALLPAQGRLPGLATLDLDAFWARYAEVAPPMLRFGLRASVDLLALSPPFVLGVPHTVLGLDAAAREALLDQALRSRVFLLRQLATTVKLVGLMAYLRDPVARARVGAGS